MRATLAKRLDSRTPGRSADIARLWSPGLLQTVTAKWGAYLRDAASGAEPS
jgi:hypothetical protein